MGISILVKNADFSALGLGNVNPLVNFFQRAGVTDPGIKSAYSNILVKGLIDNNLWDLLDVIYTFEGLTASSQGLNLKNPSFDDPFYGTFINDADNSHTDKGFVSLDATKRVMDTNFRVPLGGFVNGFACGVYNSSPSSAGILTNLTQSTPVNVGEVGLGRREVGDFTLGYYGSTYAGGDYPSPVPTATGMLQLLAPTGGNLYLIDKGILKSTSTKGTEPQGLSRSFIIGGKRLHTNGVVVAGTNSTFAFSYFSKRSISIPQAIMINTIVVDFLTSIGRN